MKPIKNMKESKNIEKRLNEIKSKPIKEMTSEEITFVIENDRTLISLERIDYTGELLRRTILRGC